jgi:DNA-binding GntR family transcriptional regulator
MKDTQHSRLQHLLKNDMLAGKLKEGALLPSENELAVKYDMARSTVRQALASLEREGYIEKHQGKGSIVSSTRKNLGILSIKGFTSVVNNPSSQFLHKPHLTTWPESLIYRISKEEKIAGCIAMKRLRSINGEPLMLELTYLPNLGLPDFCFLPFTHDSLFETLNKRYLIEIKSVDQDIRAIKPCEESIRYLQIKKNDPLLCIHLKFSTNRSELNIYSTVYCDTRNYSVGNII